MTDSQHRWWWLLLPISWMAAIFVFSSDWLAWRNTAPMAYGWLRWWLPNLDAAQLENLHLLVRKLGHVTEYALLAVLWYVALRQSHQWQAWQAGLGAAVASVLYAALDEWRQTFTAERSGSLADVLLDSLGVGLAIGSIGLLYVTRKLREWRRSYLIQRRRWRRRPRYSYAARSD